LSYQVIARRWRSQSFAELVGQTHITQTLTNALHNNRLPHALLFTGPRGTGKTSSARILAKSLRCPNAVDFVPCNQCTSCLEIAVGNSPDVREMDAASNNGVDDIRDLLSGVMHMPSTGKYKIYIIDEVHMLSTAAFNALLKTLEEPPDHVIFILATTEVHKIPQTILSRCQRFDFRRIPTRQITERLKLICDTEKISYDEEALWLMARQADGSMRDSQSLLDQVISFTNGQLTKALVTDVLGLSDRGLLMETLKSVVGRDTQGVVTTLENMARSGFEPKIFSQDLLEAFRNLLIIKISGAEMSEILQLPDSELKALAEMGAPLSQEDLHFLFDMALKGTQDISRTQDPGLVLEMLLLRMASAPQIVDLKLLIQQGPVPGRARPSLKNTEPKPADGVKKKFEVPTQAIASEKTSGGTSTPRSNSPLNAPVAPLLEPKIIHQPPTPPVAKKNLTDPKDRWMDFVEKVREKEALFAAKIENLIFSKIENNIIFVGVSPKLMFLKDQMKDSEIRKKLKAFIDSYWGPGYSLEVLLGKDSVDGQSAQAFAQKKKDDEADEIKNITAAHPKVKAAQDIFNSKIKSVTKNSN
jgi:DNA polymerase-3 subunit gamma/tau